MLVFACNGHCDASGPRGGLTFFFSAASFLRVVRRFCVGGQGGKHGVVAVCGCHWLRFGWATQDRLIDSWVCWHPFVANCEPELVYGFIPSVHGMQPPEDDLFDLLTFENELLFLDSMCLICHSDIRKDSLFVSGMRCEQWRAEISVKDCAFFSDLPGHFH